MRKEDSLLLENQLCFPLYVASRLTTKLYGPLLETLDITYPQYLVMLVLWEQDHVSVSDICARLYLESNTLTPLLKRLEQKQLVQRTRADHDERSVVITLTRKGKSLRDKAVCIPGQVVDSLHGSDLSARDVTAFHQTLWKMLHLLHTQTEALPD